MKLQASTARRTVMTKKETSRSYSDSLTYLGRQRCSLLISLFPCSLCLSTENDPNSQCAIDSMRECMIRGELLMMQGISMDFFEGITDYIDCFEEKGATCETPILKHFVTVMKAYRKHLAETQVEYGEMVDKINPFKK